MAPPLSVAIVVPVFDDDEALRRLLARVSEMIASDVGLTCIVVDGAASESTCTMCERAGVHYVASAPGRGGQLNAGAAASTAEVLWFVHADAAIDVGHVRALRRAVAEGAEGGCFRFRFADAGGWTPRLIEAGVRLRVALGGIAYGDQGLFATRAAFGSVGGFDDVPLFEEVPFVRALRRRGGFAALAVPLAVDARRWRRDGWWRRTLTNRWLALARLCGVAPARLASGYHDRIAEPKERTRDD